MIRCLNKISFKRRGVSLPELTFALLIIGFVLGIMWLRAGAIYDNFETGEAVSQIHVLLSSLRSIHPSDKVTDKENVDSLNLPPSMLGHFNNKTIIISPWHTPVTVFPGNAAAWGGDAYNDELTIRFDGVPRDACPYFIERSYNELKNFGLISIYVSTKLAEGDTLCFAEDSYCKDKAKPIDVGEVKVLCAQKNFLRVMFTLSSH